MNQIFTLAIVALFSGVVGRTLTLWRIHRTHERERRYLPFKQSRGLEARLGKYHSKWKSERAQVAVEAALIAAPLLVLALAILQIGCAFLTRSQLQFCAQEAARIEAQGKDPTSFITLNAPAGTTINATACGGGVGTVSLSAPTVAFIPNVPAFPTTLVSTAQAAATAGACS